MVQCNKNSDEQQQKMSTAHHHNQVKKTATSSPAQDLAETSKMLSLLECDQSLADNHQDSTIARFYANRSVFITGASGFVGKVLLEKLLRSCPDVRAVYILLRPKRGKQALERVDDLAECEVFSRLKSLPNGVKQLAKIHPVAGDITQQNLGLSDDDISMLNSQVSIVIHSAATVKFHEPLKVAVQNNVISVRNLLELASKLTKLDALVHVSTAYSNCDRQNVDEVLYEPPINPQQLIDIASWMTDDLLDSITPQLLGKRPNTYTYTKAVAEALLCSGAKQKLPNVPVAIIRPSIVTGSWREPLRGWVDNLNGPTGVVLAVMTGALQAMMLQPSFRGDLIPVDIVANLIICAAWQVAEKQKKAALARIQHQDVKEGSSKQEDDDERQSRKLVKSNSIDSNINYNDIKKQISVYNCVSGGLNPITWRDFSRIVFFIGYKFPCNNLLRVPFEFLVPNERIYKTIDFFNNKLVAYLGDCASGVFGKKKRFMNLYSRLDKMVYTLKPFVLNQWDFNCSNVTNLYKDLSLADKHLFNFNICDLNWDDYISRYYVGCKLFVLKDDPNKVGAAQRALRGKRLASKLLAGFLIMITYFMLIAGSELETAAIETITASLTTATTGLLAIG